MSASLSLLPPDYERRDASPRIIVLTAAGLAVCLAIVLIVAAWIYRAHYRQLPTASRDPVAMSFQHGATAQTSLARDWVEQDRSVRAHLQTYGWINREAGVARIPIERAMELIATGPARNAREAPAP